MTNKELHAELSRIQKDGIIISECDSVEEIVQALQLALKKGKSCAFIPAGRCKARFHHKDGFRDYMDLVMEQLEDFEIIIPAGLYFKDCRLIFAVKLN